MPLINLENDAHDSEQELSYCYSWSGYNRISCRRYWVISFDRLGRLKNANQDYLILSDVYYVKIDDNGAGQLVKLGAIEPHGPKDQMTISKKQVLFWENMRPDSQVVKTIQSIQ
ncbi:MAG: hypothetical protein HYX21_01375 [Candidatus Yanofskybacteria bacterium]|nr:hypothetical protein [Candidatus Yanofskybacteria bacterium]